MYKKGEMRHKNYKERKRGGGRLTRDRQRKRKSWKKKKEITTKQ